MHKIIEWASKNKEIINSYITKKDYKTLLNEYHKTSGYSTYKASKAFKCSRRAFVRYLTGERKVPMYIVNMMLQEMQIDIVENQNFVNDTNKIDNAVEHIEFDNNGNFIWYGKNNEILFNTLFAYRTLKFNETRFQAACKLNISEDVLYEYECGKRRIVHADIQKIMDVYELEIDKLFPGLVSYDGRKTFLPLKPVSLLEIDDKTYDLYEEGLYVTDEDDTVSMETWTSFPIQRYDNTGKPLLKYMPDELSIDEYANSDELIFIKDDLESFYEKDITGIKLPPNYLPLFGIFQERKATRDHIRYKKIAIKMFLKNNYTVSLLTNAKTIIFDSHDYVFSDSPWYSMLQEVDYFKKGKLTFIGDRIPQNQCIVWPDNQYIRLIELYMAKYPYKYYEEPAPGNCNGIYDNWTKYEYVD